TVARAAGARSPDPTGCRRGWGRTGRPCPGTRTSRRGCPWCGSVVLAADPEEDVLPRRHGRVAAARASLGRGRRVLEKVLVVVTGLGVGGAVVGGALVVCGAVGRGAVGRGAVGGAVVTLVGPGHGRGGGLVVGLGVIGVVRHRLHGRRDRADRRRSRGERGRGGHGSQGGRPGGVEQSFGLLVERPCRAPVGVGDERPRRRRVVR